MSFRQIDLGLAAPRMDPGPSRDPSQSAVRSAIGATHHRQGDRPSSPSNPITSETDRNRKRPSVSTDPGDEGRAKEPRRTGKSKDKATQRAAHACLRCRRQKLRCLGGNPCERCVKTSNICDFGRNEARPAADTRDTANPEGAANISSINVSAPVVVRDGARAERLQQLETSVADLLAGLAEEPDLSGQGFPNLEIFHEVIKHRKEPPKRPSIAQSANVSSLPPPTHVRPLDPIRIGTEAVISPASTYSAHNSVSQANLFTTPPDIGIFPASSESTSNRQPITATDRDRGMPIPATESLYEAPFRSLVHQVGGKDLLILIASRDETPQNAHFTAVENLKGSITNRGYTARITIPSIPG